MVFWRKTVAIISSAAIVLLAFNFFSNRHPHILPNGDIIFHAHPYQTTDNSSSFPGSAHHHTKKQLNSLDYTSVLAFFAILFAGLAFLNNPTYKQKGILSVYRHPLYFSCYFHLRAPPEVV